MIETILLATSLAIAVNIMLQPEEALRFYGILLEKLPFYVAKPFGECVKCFGGQIALWSYFFICNEYNIIEHITTISITIIIGYLWEHYAQ